MLEKISWHLWAYWVAKEIKYNGYKYKCYGTWFCIYVQFEGELFLCPGFPLPPDLDYAGYHNYVDERLPEENPSLYGLHPNAEIEFMTSTSNALFNTLLELQYRDSVGEEAVQSVEEKV